jgi:Ala-tRNA(Pro) deacylase
MPATRSELAAYLKSLGIETVTVEHAPLFTVEESQTLRGEIAGGHTKNLFLKDKKGALFLVVAEEEARIDLKRLHTRIGASGRLSFGSAEQMIEVLGVSPGAVTAFGLINDRAGRLKVVLDEGLVRHDTVNCHPLVNTATTSLRSADLVTFMRATGHEPLILPLDADDESQNL